ncbi:MAG: GDP-mannose 4,6-dehydratase [Flavobacteriaceae bacterium]
MDKPSSMRVLITGIEGFTGNYLEKFLVSKNFDVYGTTIESPTKPTHFKCDITNIEEVKVVLSHLIPDFIINLAAISFVAANPMKMYEVNVFGALNILDSLIKLKQTPKKIILASSAAVYGNYSGSLSESNISSPVNHYGNSKLAMENMAKNYFDKINILIVRPFNYTGIGQENHFLIPKIVSHFRAKKKTIELGNTHVFREYNNVNDVVEAYAKLMTSDINAEVFNLCSGKSYSISQIMSTLVEMSKHNIEVKTNPKFVRKNEIIDLKGDPSKLFRFLGITGFSYSINDTLYSMLNKNL